MKTVQEGASPSTSNYQASAVNTDPGAVNDELSRFSEFVEEEEDSHGFKSSSKTTGIKIARFPITEERLPTIAEVIEDKKSADRYCIVCLKSNLTIKALNSHVINVHGIFIGEPLSTWHHAERTWDNFLSSHPDYNSENEEDFVNETEPRQ